MESPRTNISGRGTTVTTWILGLMIFMCFCIVTLGGYVRLTGSGLAIPEWPFFTVAIETNQGGEIVSKTRSIWPPRTESAWEIQREIFVREIPGWETGVSMGEFKRMFWIEWSHRGVAKMIGVVYLTFLACVFSFPAARAMVGWKLPVAGLFMLATQATLGGFAVLNHNPAVKVSIHLTVGFLFTCLLVWQLMLMLHPPALAKTFPKGPNPVRWLVITVFAIIVVQIFSGGLVAGTRAGTTLNTWPLMGDHLVPPNMWDRGASFFWNMFENVLIIQFTHRWWAIFAAMMVVFLVLRCATLKVTPAARWTLRVLTATVILQVILGIYTLLTGVQFHLALVHQSLGLVLMVQLIVVMYETSMHPVFGEEHLAELAEQRKKATEPIHA